MHQNAPLPDKKIKKISGEEAQISQRQNKNSNF